MRISKENGKVKIRKIAVANTEGYVLLDIDEILYLKSKETYTVFHLENNTEILVSKNLGYYEKRLCNEEFIRIHNNTIVNLNKVAKYRCKDGGCLTLKNEENLPVSRNRKTELLCKIKPLC